MARSDLYTTWWEIVGDDCAFEIVVSYLAYPGSPPDLWGDYPHPGDDPEFEIQGATFLSQYGWASFPLSDADLTAIEDHIAENHEFAPRRQAAYWPDMHRTAAYVAGRA